MTYNQEKLNQEIELFNIEFDKVVEKCLKCKRLKGSYNCSDLHGMDCIKPNCNDFPCVDCNKKLDKVSDGMTEMLKALNEKGFICQASKECKVKK